MEEGIRPLTIDERKTIEPLNSPNVLTTFLKKLNDEHIKYRRKYRPFDSYSAKLNFESYIKNRAEKIASTIGRDQVDLNVDFDLKVYGESSRFEYKGKEEYQVSKVVQNVNTHFVTGMRYKFIAKERLNKISIFVPTEVVELYEKWLFKTYPDAAKLDKQKYLDENIFDDDEEVEEEKEEKEDKPKAESESKKDKE